MEQNLLFQRKVDYYNDKNFKKIIVVPDIIVESEGLACGDKLTLALSERENKILFNITSQGCRICTASSNFLMEKLSGKSDSEIHQFIDEFLNEKYDSSLKWMEWVPLERKDCIRTPFKLLGKALISSRPQCDIRNSAELLACDACVKSFRINWREEKREEKKKNFMNLIWKINSLDNKMEIKLQRLGKCNLSKKEIAELKDLMKNLNKKLYKQIKKLRLSMLYHNNLKKYSNYSQSNEVSLLAKKQIVSKNISIFEINKINQHIKEKKWQISKVKGSKTSDYYDEGLYRTHLDYDYVANEIKDGLLFINYLINQKGFKFVTGGSVPFSLKIVDDYNQQETLTGHLHLEKIIQDSFQIVIDINLGGFPLGRSGVVKLNEKNIISIEEQFIITLCHIFKHEKVFMKDINDIYYLLKSGEIDYGKLLELIALNNLEYYFYILMEYMKINFEISDIEKYKSIKAKLLYKIPGNHWPYSRKKQFWIKFFDTMSRSINKNGFIKGSKEGYRQVIGKKLKGIKTKKYSAINSQKNSRTYLYPAVIFKESINLKELKKEHRYVEVLKDHMFSYKGRGTKLIISSFGIFITQENMNESKDRVLVEDDIKKILSILKINVSSVNQEYIMQARQDLWLY